MSTDNSSTSTVSRPRSDAWEQSAAVRRYLEASEKGKNKPKFRRSPERMQARIDDIDAEIPAAPVLKRLSLIQEKNNLKAGLVAKDTQIDMSELENDFAMHAKSFAERKNIGWAAWRAMGVPVPLLKRAGISR